MQHDEYCEKFEAFDACSCSFRILAEPEEIPEQLVNDDFCVKSVSIKDTLVIFTPVEKGRREDFEF